MAKRKPPSKDGVGPGRPPRSTQFKPGQSGNPGGRPKKERDIRKLLDKELDGVVVGSENGAQIKITKREFIIKKLVNHAASGNLKAIDRVIALVGSTGPAEDQLVAVDPALLASFLTRHGTASGGSGAAA